MSRSIRMKMICGILLVTMIAYCIPSFAYIKEESVYSKLDNNGNCYLTTVSSHLKNTNQDEFIKDLSDLMNIENVSGDETFERDGDSLRWKANGDDIYYTGKSEKELPIECKITYELNGEEISKEDIAGKEGKVKVTLKYINKDEHKVNINGKQVTMYTPFVVVCGTIIDNENNKNIEITNGKVIDDGTKTVVFGISMPGLQESLGISEDTIEIPSKVEISMDAKSFEMNEIYAFATPKVLEENDIEVFENLDNIYSKVNTLQSSMNLLEDGANTLKDGTDTYYEKSQEFNSAMKQVSAGVTKVNSNYIQIDNGINSLKDGSSSLASGAEALDAGIETLGSKLTSLPESVLALYKGSTSLRNGITSVKAGVTQVEETLTNTTKQIVANNTTIKDTIEKLEEAGYSDDDVVIINLQNQIKENNKILSNLTSEKAQASIEELNSGLNSLSTGATNLETGLSKLNIAAKELPNAIEQLEEGSKKIMDGTNSIKTGTNTLSKGSTALKSGIQTLDTSTKNLTSANNQLTDGAATLQEGATSLASGVTKLNKEGITPICSEINGEVKDLQTRFEKLQDLADNYNCFTMLDSSSEGSVKFIIMIDSLKKEDEKEQAIVEDERKYE